MLEARVEIGGRSGKIDFDCDDSYEVPSERFGEPGCLLLLER